MSDLAHEEVDLTNEDIQQCPYEAYKKLREQAPVYQDPKTGFFIVFDATLSHPSKPFD